MHLFPFTPLPCLKLTPDVLRSGIAGLGFHGYPGTSEGPYTERAGPAIMIR